MVKRLLILFFAATLALVANAVPGGKGKGGPKTPDPVSGTAELTWTMPTTRANGEALAPEELAGYEIYVYEETRGEESMIVISDPRTTSYTLSNLDPGVYLLAISAVDRSNLVSELSDVVTKTIQ